MGAAGCNVILLSAFKFSLQANTIIWLTFGVLTVAKKLHYNFMLALILPFIGFIISLVGATFTIGLLLSAIFKRNINKNLENH